MSLEQAREVAAWIDAARDEMVSQGEVALETFSDAVRALLAGNPTPGELRGLLTVPAGVLLSTLALAWRDVLNALLRRVHAQVGLPAPTLIGTAEARDLMDPVVGNLTRAALLVVRTENPVQAWGRQYDRGGAFVAVRGTLRATTAGVLTTVASASVINSARANAPNVILGAYNPLDERTGTLDRALVLNRGDAITTARGREVRSIPGRVGKYTLANAWVPGPPAQGGDTHVGCRCWLVPEPP